MAGQRLELILVVQISAVKFHYMLFLFFAVQGKETLIICYI